MSSHRPSHRKFLTAFEVNAVLVDLRQRLVSGRYCAEAWQDDDRVISLTPLAGHEGDVVQIRFIEQTYSPPRRRRRTTR